MKVRRHKLLPSDVVAISFALALAVAWTLSYYWHQYDGDDMVYMLELTDCDGVGHGRNSLWELPLLAAKHWVLNNGRAANIIFTIPMVSLLPKWLNAALCGFLFFAMLMLACQFTGALDHGKPTVSLAVMTVFALAFPWWNEGFQFCVAMNYVATSAFILGLIALRRFPSFVCRHRCLCALFAFVTGMMHESASISVIAGAVVCLCLRYKTLNLRIIYKSLPPTDRLLAKAFAVGAAIAVFSPGIWMRFFKVQAGLRQFYDGALSSLVLSTLPLLLVLLAVVLLIAVSRRGRARLRPLFADRTFAFCCMAALTASFFVFASRLAGNSGWFAELFSLCGLARMAVLCHHGACGRPLVGVAVAVAALVVAHSFYVAAAQKRYFEATGEIRAIYAAVDDEVVFYDVPGPFTDDKMLLDRVHDVNNGDIYTSTVVAAFYGRENIIVLPESYRDVNLDSLLACAPGGFMRVDDEIMLSAALPASAEPFRYWTGARGWVCTGINGRDYTVRPFRHNGVEYYAFLKLE